MAYAVEPRLNCPHLSKNFNAETLPASISVTAPCRHCDNIGENWICLSCFQVNCSRHVKGHAAEHFEAKKHAVAVSFSDLSVWCYECDSYIKHRTLEGVLQLMRDNKFGNDSSSDATVASSDNATSPSDDGTPDDNTDDEDDGAAARMIEQLTLGQRAPERPPREPVLPSLDFDGLVAHIKSGKAKKIVVMSGAGMSVAAGIPDFRTPGTGLYDNLQKYNLPTPTAVFDISFFRTTPEPFYMLAKELYPGNFKPTPAHYFIRLLHEKGVLLRNYTQNIDTLERVAKVPAEMLVEAHGSFGTATCVSCKAEGDVEFVRECVFADKLPRCEKCDGLIKPDIVFFGESLPSRFFDSFREDFPKCDLLLVMGTSLKVHPFASLIDYVPEHTPRVLINREMAGQANALMLMLGRQEGFEFGLKSNYRDVALLGDLQDSVWKLVDALGWKEDLEKLVAEDI
eukprot:TRINITY_DN10143_c0_g1_i2.p1 TRINITY_DN10143_c0_g1~~TRINITY_DN10143_c0_g1_i2.p1  ORF type:complete len:455 (+),score=85.60 TRINITY_DN10143_c0_g1_i2:118-1482(+)